MIGSCYAGIQHVGIREATVNKEGPLQTVDSLMQYAEEFRKYAGMSKWRRWFERMKLKLKTMLAILRKR